MTETQAAEIQQGDLSIGRRWFSFIIVLLISILGSMAMFKASPLLPELMTDMGFTSSNIGLMMSMYTIIGVVLAFPAGGILSKIGYKGCLIIVCLSLIIGGLLGAVATSVTMLLVSRVIEGIANGIIAVIASASVTALLPADKQGLGMGLSSIWFPGGAIIALNLAPAIAAGGSWRGVWWFMVVIAVILLVLVLVCFKVPTAQGQPEKAEEGAAPAAFGKPMWASIIITSIVMGCFGLVFGGAAGNFYPTFLQQVHGMDSQMAGFATSIINIFNVVFGPIAGLVSDKKHTKKGLIVAGTAVMAVLYLFAFSSVMPLVWVYIFIMGICNAFIATGLYSVIPVLAQDPRKIGLGMACLAFFQNIGIFCGSTFFGMLQASSGWNTADLTLLLPVAIAAFILAIIIKMPKAADAETEAKAADAE